jgi:hypothetical protein
MSLLNDIFALRQMNDLRADGLWPTTVVPVPPNVPTVIGQSFGGGYYAGQISTNGNGVATHYLIVGPISTAQSNLQWKTVWTTTDGTSSNIDGPTNSTNMNNASHPAAQFCEGLSVGGFTDWYLPAKDELEVCYYNLKPTTATNNTSSGSNNNAVPSRGNYTSGTPARTSAADFTGAEAFNTLNAYWSSTQYDFKYARTQLFNTGRQYYNGYFSNKQNNRFTRAVRRIPV